MIYIHYNRDKEINNKILTETKKITLQKNEISNYFNNVELYLNLTNGLELLPFVNKFKVVRIQSTLIENKKYEYIIKDLDNGFLFDLALGKNCFIADFSKKEKITKALNYGIAFTKTLLYKIWFNKEYIPLVKNLNLYKYYINIIKSLDKKTLNKIKYFRKFLLTDKINIHIIEGLTKNDGGYNYFHNLLKQNINKN